MIEDRQFRDELSCFPLIQVRQLSNRASTLFDISFLLVGRSDFVFSGLPQATADSDFGLRLAQQIHRTVKMLKVSILETGDQRKLILEGKLVSPWTEEVESAWRQAQEQLGGRKLIVDLTNLTLIARDGEDTLLNLMRAGARFTGCDVLTRHLLKKLSRRCRCQP